LTDNKQPVQTTQANELATMMSPASDTREEVCQGNYPSTPILNNILMNAPQEQIMDNLRNPQNNNNQSQPNKPSLSKKAQYKLSRDMTSTKLLILQSINETLNSIPPRELPFTKDEIRIILQLNPSQFNVQTTINMHAFKALTKQHPNQLFIEYL
ncbi:24029_t:CDS:2, partial [Dentiscutata erythropus]